MASHSWLSKAGFAVVVHVLSLMTSSQVILDDPLLFCDLTANVTSDCCLNCFNATCNNTCPEGQLTLNFTQDFPTCVYSNDVNSTSSEETPRDFVVVCLDTCPVTYYREGDFCTKCEEVCDSCSGPGITDNCTCTVRDNGRCVTRCHTGSYNDNGNCVRCDDACKSCNGSGRDSDTCVCKFEFNGTCYESCQSNLTECDDGGDDESNNTIIIAAAVGGGVAVIVIIVAIVIVLKCCRRRRVNKKTRMSTIIESRDDLKQQEEEETGIQLPTKAKGKKPGKYENVTVLGGAVSAQAQDTQDKMTRYAKDPTLPRGKSLEDQPDMRESGLYANADTIQLQRQLTGEAGNTKSKRGVFSKFKQSVKNVSRKSKNKGANSNDISGSQNPVFEDPQSGDSGQDYVDMTGNHKEEEEQEDYVQLNQRQDDGPQEAYEPFQNTATIPSDEPQEEYENFGHTSMIHTVDEEPQDEYENFGAVSNVNIADMEPQDDYENFVNTSKVNVPDDEPQDEYENFRPLSTNEESPYINVTHFRKEK